MIFLSAVASCVLESPSIQCDATNATAKVAIIYKTLSRQRAINKQQVRRHGGLRGQLFGRVVPMIEMKAQSRYGKRSNERRVTTQGWRESVGSWYHESEKEKEKEHWRTVTTASDCAVACGSETARAAPATAVPRRHSGREGAIDCSPTSCRHTQSSTAAPRRSTQSPIAGSSAASAAIPMEARAAIQSPRMNRPRRLVLAAARAR